MRDLKVLPTVVKVGQVLLKTSSRKDDPLTLIFVYNNTIIMGDQREDVKYSPVAGEEDLVAEDSNMVTSIIEMKKMDSQSIAKNVNLSYSSESGTRKFLYIAVCAGNLAAFTCGTSFGWTSPIIPKLNGAVDPENNPLSTPLTSDQESWLGSLLPVGAALGPIAAGIYVDKIGRKKTLLVSVIPFLIAFSMATFVSNINLFFLVRFMCGLAVGGVFTVLPIYVGEIAEDAVRGALGSFMQLFITFGILYSYCIGPYVSITAFNIACIIVPSIFLPLFIIYIPESPHFLIAAGDMTDAERALKKLRARSSDGVQKELLEIKQNLEESMANKSSFMDIFKSRGLTKALILSVGLASLQQFSGINVILFYTQTIFAATGSTIPPEICTIIIGVVQVTSSFLSPVLVDKMGKRFLLMFSAAGMGLSEAILGYYFYLQNKGENLDSVFWLPVVCLIGYNITYCMGFGPLPWAVMGELFPASIKSVASTVTASGCWILAFIITKFFGNVTDAIGIAGSFWIFAGCCGFAFLFVYKWLPETSGRSLQEIQDILNGIKQ